MARIAAEQRRQDFIDATVRVIATHGLPDATTRRIADAAGAPLASLHYCFHSKDELFFAVFEAQAKMLGDRVGRSTPGAGLADTATQAFREVISWYREHRDWAVAQLELGFWAMRQDPKRRFGARSFDIHIKALTANLRRSCAPTDDATLAGPAARLISTLSDGLILEWFAYDDDARLEDGVSRAAEALRLYLESGGHQLSSRQSPRKRPPSKSA